MTQDWVTRDPWTRRLARLEEKEEARERAKMTRLDDGSRPHLALEPPAGGRVEDGRWLVAHCSWLTAEG